MAEILYGSLHKVELAPGKSQLKKEPVLHHKYSSPRLQISSRAARSLGSICRIRRLVKAEEKEQV